MKILSLGAGVQSSTIFLMSCYGEIERLDAAIFADTGWESNAVYTWLTFLQNEATRHSIPIYIVSHGNIKDDSLKAQVRGRKIDGVRWASMPFFTRNRESGQIGMIRRQCTTEYKIVPIEKKARELAGYRPRQRIPIATVEAWKGISADEIRRANISRTKWIDFYYPLIELGMARADCLFWFQKHGLPMPPRSACLGCPYHSNAEWAQIKKTSPIEWQEVVDFDRAIRLMGGMRGDCFLHRRCIPLDEVDFDDKHTGQIDLFDNSFREECQGVCGV
jgi:hypothetical protein